MSGCGIDYREGRLFLTIARWSTEGFKLNVFFSEVLDFAPSALGSHIRKAMSTARADADARWERSDLYAQADELYAAAGTSGWTEFMRGAAHVAVTEDGDGVVVTPSRNAGSREGFVYASPEDSVRVEDPSDADLGVAALEGLRLSGADL